MSNILRHNKSNSKSRKLGEQESDAILFVHPDRAIDPLGDTVAWGILDPLDLQYRSLPYELTHTLVLVGRQRDCDIILNSEEVSRIHALLVWQQDHAVIIDRNSMNGTIINGTPVRNTAYLQHGDIIEICNFRLRFLYSEESGLSTIDTENTDKIMIHGAVPSPMSLFQARLHAITGPLNGRNWPIATPTTTIGRAHSNIISIPHTSVSRKHAIVLIQQSGVYIVDTSGYGGVSVNGKSITGPTLLQNSDHIQIGDCLFTIAIEVTPAAMPELPTQMLSIIQPDVQSLPKQFGSQPGQQPQIAQQPAPQSLPPTLEHMPRYRPGQQ